MKTFSFIVTAIFVILWPSLTSASWTTGLNNYELVENISFRLNRLEYTIDPEVKRQSASVRYDASLDWKMGYFEIADSYKWRLQIRPRFEYAYEDEFDILVDDQSSAQVNGFYGELREFIITRYNVFNTPSLWLSAGRQYFRDDFGLWWNDTIESVSLHLDDGINKGFIATGSQRFNYNTDDNQLDDAEEDIVYFFGEIHRIWAPHQTIGVRYLAELNGNNGSDDNAEFNSYSVGLALRAEQHPQSLPFDYYLDMGLVNRDISTITISEVDENRKGGWFSLIELGRRLTHFYQGARVAARVLVTDSPEDSTDGFVQNTLQSTRSTWQSYYNRGLAGRFTNLRPRNVLMFGGILQIPVRARRELTLSIFDIRRRNLALEPAETLNINYASANGHRIGSVFDAQYLWRSFPYALDGKHLEGNVVFNVGFFRPGEALISMENDYSVSMLFSIRY